MNEARVAGVDTRDARATPTVRAAARAAAFVAGPGWVAAIAAPQYWRRWFEPPAWARPWLVVVLVLAGLAAAQLAWRREPFGPRARDRVLPVGADAALVFAVMTAIAASSRDELLVAALLPFGPVLAGWTVGRAARLAAESCVPGARSAAAGLVTTWAFVGLLVAGHLTLVLDGSGPRRALVWALVYLGLGLVALSAAGRAIARDREQVARRARMERPDASRSGRPHEALALDSITVRFGPNLVLRETTLRAAPGELVALVGGNGAGKSTLLRVAAGLLVPESGRMFVAGEDVSELLPEERAAAGLAFVSGARPVFPDLTVVENLRVAAFRTHLTGRAFERATESVLELVPVLAARRGAKAGVLSGGEQRLLAVAQTLYRRPVVLLADELSLGLDAGARIAVLELLRLLADQGVAVVAVDHDLPALLPLADRAALLVAGAVTEFTPASRVLEDRADLLPATFLAGASG